MTQLAAVDNSSLQERVYRELRCALQQGRLTSGQQLTIRALARAVGTSEMPVREAVKRLLAEGALQQAANRSLQIVPIERARLQEMTRIRIALEGMAARLAVEAADKTLATILGRINSEMRMALQTRQAADVLSCNQEFHFTIYRAAESPQLFEIIEMLWLRSGPYLALAYAGPHDARPMFEQATTIHDRLVKALRRRDAEMVQQSLALDIARAADWYINHHQGEAGASAPIARRVR